MAALSKSIEADPTITIDRRRGDRREPSSGAPRPATKQPRRRHIDPTTCERDYHEDELEFMRAMDDYKRSSGRMFPTCSEVLEVVRGMGYVRLTPEQLDVLGDSLQPATTAGVPQEDSEAADEPLETL